MLRSIAAGIACLVLAGCVSTKTIPMKTDQLAKFQGGTIALAARPKPDFAAMTAGKAMFGMIGAAAMISAGNTIIKENEVEDPAIGIGQELIKNFQEVHPGKLAKQYANVDLLLDLQTINWSFTYFPADWNSYRVIYSVKMRVIDTRQGRLLAEGFCSRVPEKTPSAPSRDELLANKADRLKQELARSANQCLSELREKVLPIVPAKTAAR
jgi:hypothetical protein